MSKEENTNEELIGGGDDLHNVIHVSALPSSLWGEDKRSGAIPLPPNPFPPLNFQ